MMKELIGTMYVKDVGNISENELHKNFVIL